MKTLTKTTKVLLYYYKIYIQITVLHYYGFTWCVLLLDISAGFDTDTYTIFRCVYLANGTMTPVYNPHTITDSYIFDSDAKVTVLSCGYFCVYDFSDTTHCTRRRLAGGSWASWGSW